MNINESLFSVLADILGLSLFSGLRDSLLLGTFKNLVESISEEKTEDAVFFSQSNSTLDMVEKWAAFTEAFISEQKGGSFYLAVAYMAVVDENAYTLAAENLKNPCEGGPAQILPPVLCAIAKTDLSRLGRIAAFDIPSLGFYIAETCRKSGLDIIAGNIEEESRVFWAAEGKKANAEIAESLLAVFPENTNWGLALPPYTEFVRQRGAGLMGLYQFFRWEWTDSSISLPPLNPVRNPDPVTLADFAGYQEQRSLVIANTLRFLEGKAANNLLLYGDRGTGKSATVKAVCNEYASRGLRLLEVSKTELGQLPVIMDFLGSRGRRFIIFIDDLSFESMDDSYTGLKALLEGCVEAKPSNVVIYATSNRRHLVKEEKNGARAFDTVEEQISLSDRFGLTVIYSAPDQDEYLKIAEHIARRRGIAESISAEQFRENALRWERWFNGRSPRTAAQYVDWIAGGEDLPGNLRFPWE
jgi:predicted AAA+ superfamily ATPase